MNLFDVDVLIYAFRRDSSRHEEYRSWLLDLINGDSAFGVSEQVLSAVIRVTTHPRVFKQPSKLQEAVSFTEGLRHHPRCRLVSPSVDHWPVFVSLCKRADVRGNLVTDAWFAALAIETGCTWITTDRDFARFPRLKWKHPLDHDKVIENPG